MYSTDGIPQWYHDELQNSNLMQSLKEQVFAHLDNDNTATLPEIMSVNEIHPAFEQEVEEFMGEWEG
jgi:hypothetical protein